MSTRHFKNKNILITGITGFIGSHLSERLKKEGANVYGIALSGKGKNILTGSIANFALIHNFIKRKSVDICFHLAAESLVESGQKQPFATFKTNVQGTFNVLEAVRRNKVQRAIIASTAHVYGDGTPPFKETDMPRPSRPYETSKVAADLIAQSYADSFDLPVFIPRFVNIYGPRDINFGRLVPKTIKSIIQGKNPTLWGGNVRRDFLYIDDAVEAYLALASAQIDKIRQPRIFNFGSGEVITVEKIMKTLISISGRKISIDKIKPLRESEVPAQFVSWQRARRLLSWSPKVRLKAGLSHTYNWYNTSTNLLHNHEKNNTH